MNVINVNSYVFGAAPVTWTFVDSATSTGAAITIPAGAQEGDVAILGDYARATFGTPTLVTPTNWTEIATSTASLRPVMRSSFRVLPASPGGTNVTGMDGNFSDAKAMIVLRPSRPIASVDILGLNAEYSENNPASQNVGSASGTPGLFVVGIYASSNAIDPRTFSPAADGEVTPATTLYIKYKIYNGSPADVTVDMDDEGSDNMLHSFYVEAT